MNDIKKAIEFLEWNKHYLSFDGSEIKLIDIAIQALQLMQKQEQGLVIELPCKVGDELFNNVEHCVGLNIYENQIHSGIIEEIRVDIFCNGGIYSCSLNDIGKTVFLTKEQAEQKLKELNGEVDNGTKHNGI